MAKTYSEPPRMQTNFPRTKEDEDLTTVLAAYTELFTHGKNKTERKLPVGTLFKAP